MEAPSARGTPPRIWILPEEVKSRIAAGEVIERPASVLKELVENALDAGARHVHVELAGGGRELIRVTDDGCGLGPEDLALSVRRHATSKLSSADDLYALSTFGFRGEALPAIGSVSRMALLTRPRGSDPAWRLEVTGGREGAVEPAAGAFGTSVEVRDLFYNLPARRKFLKGPGPELTACVEMLVRIALFRPDVSFRLAQADQELLSCEALAQAADPPERFGLVRPPPGTLARRASELLGRAATQDLVGIEFSDEPFAEAPREASLPPGAWPARTEDSTPYRLSGLLSPPARSRPNRSQLYLALNGRPVRDRTFATAVIEAYREWLPARRFPAAVLLLEVPGSDVDINVHPTKAEVRFRYPSRLFALCHAAVRAAFTPRPERQATETTESTEDRGKLEPKTGEPRPETRSFDLWQGERSVPAPPSHAPRVAEAPAPYAAPREAGSGFRVPGSEFRRAADQPGTLSPKPETERSPFRVLGQAAGAYIVIEYETGLKVLDQHAVHERVLFEELAAQGRSGRRGDAQGLLVPETVELTPAQAAAFADPHTRAALEELGYELAEFGPRALLVQAVPAVLKTPRAAGLVAEILEGLADGASDPAARPVNVRPALRAKAAELAACKGAVKAGERLSLAQMEGLVAEFLARVSPSGGTCPHGRPLAVELTWDELERRVGRA